MGRFCELCEERAAVYCCADEAYVCWECDAKVHGANFIVARHVRSVLCRRCQFPTPTLPGSCSSLTAPLCPTCACSSQLEGFSAAARDDLVQLPSEQSGTTITEDGNNMEEVSSGMSRSSNNKRRRRASSPDSVIPKSKTRRLIHKEETEEEEKLENLLRQWNRQLGAPSRTCSPRTTDHIISVAMQLLRRLAGSIKSRHVERLDARAALAACLWIALKLDSASFPCSGLSEAPRVDKFEQCTGIPADVVLNVEAKLCRLCTNFTRSPNVLDLTL